MTRSARKAVKRLSTKSRYRKIAGQRRYYDTVSHRSITAHEYKKRTYQLFKKLPTREQTSARKLAATKKKAIRGRKVREKAQYDRLVTAFQARMYVETGKRPTKKQVAVDPRFRQALSDLRGPYRGRGRGSKKAKALVTLGLRDSSWSFPVGESPRGELSTARAVAILEGF